MQGVESVSFNVSFFYQRPKLTSVRVDNLIRPSSDFSRFFSGSAFTPVIVNSQELPKDLLHF